jgi:hypothetical protein
MTAQSFGKRFTATLAVALLALCGGIAAAAPAPIYKCFDRHLAVVYTDLPCKDGEQLDLRAGDADPAAVARLERERDALDRSSAQRITDLRRAALERQQYLVEPNYAPSYAPNYDAAAYADMAGYFPYGYAAFAGVPQYRQRSPEARPDRRGARRSVVPTRIPPLMR